MVCLGNEQRAFCRFWDCIQYCILDSFVDCDDYSISSKGFLPIVVDIMVIWVKFTHYSSFNSLIFKMLMFTLVISCLTTSNLPWFMDLIFQVPIQYCSGGQGGPKYLSHSLTPRSLSWGVLRAFFFIKMHQGSCLHCHLHSCCRARWCLSDSRFLQEACRSSFARHDYNR